MFVYSVRVYVCVCVCEREREREAKIIPRAILVPPFKPTTIHIDDKDLDAVSFERPYHGGFGILLHPHCSVLSVFCNRSAVLVL